MANNMVKALTLGLINNMSVSWKDDDKHGQGTLTWADGDQYVGDFVNGKRTGQGTYTDVNGNQYIGEWKDGMKHGQGTFP